MALTCLSWIYRYCYRLVLFALVPMIAFNGPALADPSPWAQAHGYYKRLNGYDSDDDGGYAHGDSDSDSDGDHKRKHRNKHRHDGYHDDVHDLLPWLAGGAVGGYLAGNKCNREALGAVLGGVVGGVAGSRVGKGDGREVATIAGALVGALVGQSIGRHMDRTDQYCTGQVLEYATDRQTVGWHNPDAGTRYSVTPMNYYKSRDGRYCREYTSEATIGDQKQQIYGTACRQADGSWQIVS